MSTYISDHSYASVWRQRGNSIEEDEVEVCDGETHRAEGILKQCACINPPVVECSRNCGSRWHLSVHGI